MTHIDYLSCVDRAVKKQNIDLFSGVKILLKFACSESEQGNFNNIFVSRCLNDQ